MIGEKDFGIDGPVGSVAWVLSDDVCSVRVVTVNGKWRHDVRRAGESDALVIDTLRGWARLRLQMSVAESQ